MTGLSCIKRKSEYECLAMTIIQSELEEGNEPTAEYVQDWIKKIDNLLLIHKQRSLMNRKNGLLKDLKNYLAFEAGLTTEGKNQDFVLRRFHKK